MSETPSTPQKGKMLHRSHLTPTGTSSSTLALFDIATPNQVQNVQPVWSTMVHTAPDSQPPELQQPPAYSSLPTARPGNDEYDDDEDQDAPILTIHLNASTSVAGNSNIISVHPIDSARLAALILHSLRQPVANVNLKIDCGVVIRGERNVVGAAGLNRASSASVSTLASAVVGSRTRQQPSNPATSAGPEGEVQKKRKAVDEAGDERMRKELKTDGAAAGALPSNLRSVASTGASQY